MSGQLDKSDSQYLKRIQCVRKYHIYMYILQIACIKLNDNHSKGLASKLKCHLISNPNLCTNLLKFCFKITNQIDLKYVLPKLGTKNK